MPTLRPPPPRNPDRRTSPRRRRSAMVMPPPLERPPPALGGVSASRCDCRRRCDGERCIFQHDVLLPLSAATALGRIPSEHRTAALEGAGSVSRNITQTLMERAASDPRRRSARGRPSRAQLQPAGASRAVKQPCSQMADRWRSLFDSSCSEPAEAGRFTRRATAGAGSTHVTDQVRHADRRRAAGGNACRRARWHRCVRRPSRGEQGAISWSTSASLTSSPRR